MASVVIPYSFTNGTTADANQVNSNFNYLKGFIESSVVQTDGSTSVAAGSVSLDKLASAVANALCPTGSVVAFAGGTVPTGWLLCDGQEVQQSLYPNLYAAIGGQYATSGGQLPPSVGYFRVPLLTGRVAVGRNASDLDFDTLGDTGGAKNSVGLHRHDDGTLNAVISNATHQHGSGTLGTTTNGDHGHNISSVGDHTHIENQAVGDTYATYASNGFNNYTQTGSVAGYTDPAGGHGHSTTSGGPHGHTIGGSTAQDNAAHNHDVAGQTADQGTANGNLQPFIVLNYIIKAA